MFRKSVLLIALILPIALPLYFVGDILLFRQSAEIHRIKIEGYDPRDLLRGHYLRYSFISEDVEALPFSQEVKVKINKLPHRYYVPEDHAKYLEDLLLPMWRRQNQEEAVKLVHDIRIGVGITRRGEVFIEKLYIDGETMEDHLTTHR